MAMPEWKVVVLAIGIVLLLLHESLWQWWWWKLDDTDNGFTACSGNQILVSNDSKTVICQPCPVCGPGMILLPPCGSILTLDTVIKCTSILTKVPRGRKRKKSTKSPELNKANSPTKWIKNAYLETQKDTNNVKPQNENFIAWSSLDVRDIYDTEEYEDANLSEVADLKEFLSSTQDVQGMIPTPPTKISLPNAVSRWRQRRVNPKFPTSKRAVRRPIPSPPIEAKTWSRQFKAQRPVVEQINKIPSNITDSSQNINNNCFLGSLLGTSLGCLVFAAALGLTWLLFSFIRTTYASAWSKKHQGWCLLNGRQEPEQEVEERSYFNGDVDVINAANSYCAVSGVTLKHLKLSEIPLDLEDLLAKKLDVRRKGERLYGWQKVGAAFKIDSDDLDFLELEYQKNNGSPTRVLFSILGISKGKTLSDLVNVLRSQKVKLHDVTSMIKRKIKATNKFQ